METSRDNSPSTQPEQPPSPAKVTRRKYSKDLVREVVTQYLCLPELEPKERVRRLAKEYDIPRQTIESWCSVGKAKRVEYCATEQFQQAVFGDRAELADRLEKLAVRLIALVIHPDTLAEMSASTAFVGLGIAVDKLRMLRHDQANPLLRPAKSGAVAEHKSDVEWATAVADAIIADHNSKHPDQPLSREFVLERAKLITTAFAGMVS